ncbi:hypothetical protein [Bradyrhizobium sp. PRIMUS42]|uniref:hypothetical protein n=1 Tax=Bradyrhizobium sp. PRIMUS42 TaxID=2908926 RepID=UPI001FF2D8D7|nr:hypothetical protein [Bradyrhizobium sp. PRIMUS42]MCJ9730257.1 hypothetical protein [Bradyrhizobium sp. PRIMUS42]
MMNSIGSAPAERIVAWSIGGMSGSTSFTAIWLKPQVRHSMSIRAMAPALRGRATDWLACGEDMSSRKTGFAPLLLYAAF